MIDRLKPVISPASSLLPSAAISVCSSMMTEMGLTAERLTNNEIALSKRLTSPARRQEFISGRILAKQAIQQLTHKFFALHKDGADAFEILSEDTSKSSSKPIVFQNGRPADINVSISHCDGHAVAAVSDSRCRLGIDVVRIGSVTRSTQSLWFSNEELRQVDNSSDPDIAAAEIWSIKEAAFKAAGESPVFHPRKWVVRMQNDEPNICFDGTKTHLTFQFFLLTNNLLLTVATDSALTANNVMNAASADREFYSGLKRVDS